jgi:hypothetical protein
MTDDLRPYMTAGNIRNAVNVRSLLVDGFCRSLQVSQQVLRHSVVMLVENNFLVS